MPSRFVQPIAPVNLRSVSFWAAIIFATLLVFAGGASRYDSFAQTAVRLAATVTISMLLFQNRLRLDRSTRPVAILLALVAILVAAQLIPLPPAIWTHMPGRALYTEAAAMVGRPQPWRPINLTPDLGFDALLGLLPAAAALLIYVRTLPEHRPATIGVIGMIAVASALLGLLQLISGGDSLLYYYHVMSTGTPTGVFANRNHQAALLALALPVMALWATRSGDGPVVGSARIWLGLTGTLVSVMTLVAAGSRTGLVLGALALFFSGYFWWKPYVSFSTRLRPPLRLLSHAAIGISLSAIVGATVVFGRAQSIDRLVVSDFNDDPRLQLWGAIKAMGQAFFPIGSGAGSFDQVFPRFEPNNQLTYTYLNQAHNDFAQVLIEGGLPGLALMLLYLAWWTTCAVSIWRERPSYAIDMGRLGSMVTLLLLISCAVDYPLRTPLLGVVFLVASMWMTAAGRTTRKIA